jgi:hypothetical protein
MVDNEGSKVDARARFWRNLVGVMTMQVVSLLLLWLLQRHYTV